MNEAQVNGTQADETLAGGPLDDETTADEVQDDGNGAGGPDVEKLRRIRLSGFLRELVREEGKMEAAELLGVNYKTLARAEETGKITGRMGDALERLLGTGDDPEVAKLRERVDALEGGVEALAKELRDGLGEIRAAVAGSAESQGQDQARRTGSTTTGRAGRRPGPPLRWRGCVLASPSPSGVWTPRS